MSVTFTSQPPPERPEKMTPQWTARWEVICERLIRAAQDRGGLAVRHGDNLELHSPGRGVCIAVYLISPGIADVDAGVMHSVSCDWALTDDADEDLEAVVLAIMNGGAEVTVSSTWTIRHRSGQASGGSAEPSTWMLPAWS